MKTTVSQQNIDRKKIFRHKLQKHRKLQYLTSEIYLKYCERTGFLHVLPDFLIIGFVKCGTTSLYEHLLRHPSVFSPRGKEIDYFDRFYARGLSWYRTKFPSKLQKNFVKNWLKQDFVTGEATPRYIEHPHALQRIKEILPKAKFIVLLRNPVDRAYSHYNQNLHLNYEYLSFQDAIAVELERTKKRYEKMQKDETYYSWDYELYAYLQHGIYFHHLERWMKVFSKEQFLIIPSEEFSQNTNEYYNKVLTFLNLPKWELSQYKKYKQRTYINPKIEPSLRKKLVEYFKPHNAKLYKLIGTNFHWDD